MTKSPNPFESPNPPVDWADDAEVKPPRWTYTRRLAVGLLVLPILLAGPIYWWSFEMAEVMQFPRRFDSWDEWTKRSLFFAAIQLALTILTSFGGVLLLWLDGWNRLLSGTLAALTGILVLPAIFVFIILLVGYFEFY